MKILLAVSGGIDSMCMATMAPELFRESGFSVAHCNFGLRGADSDADEALVRTWCDARGIPCFVRHFDTAGYAARRGISIEMAARELRYAWFRDLCETHGFDAVAVAHNAEDNVETLLLHLLRGTGGRGLRGLSSEGRILRPLLGWSREQIRAYAREHDVPYREDASNADTRFRRNRLRHEVLPVFRELNPSYLQTFAREMQHFAQENDIAEDYFRGCGIAPEADDIPLDTLLGLKHWRYVLFRLTERCKLDGQTFDALCRTLEGTLTRSGKEFRSPTHRIVITQHSLLILPLEEPTVPEPVCIPGPGDYAFGGRTIRIEQAEPAGALDTPGVLVADAAALPFPFQLRSWREGDWMQPFGMQGRKKLSDLFADLKWSRPQKEAAVIAAPCGEDSHVYALLGVRMGESLRITEASRSAVRLRIASGSDPNSGR